MAINDSSMDIANMWILQISENFDDIYPNSHRISSRNMAIIHLGNQDISPVYQRNMRSSICSVH